MSTPRRVKLMLVSATAVVGASLCGVALGHFAQGDAFSFYKQSGPIWPQFAMPEAPPATWSYPAQQAAQPVAYAPPPQPVYRLETATPRYQDAAVYWPAQYPAPALEETADGDTPQVAEPVIRVSSGSWAEPAKPEAAPAAPTKEAVKEAADDTAPVEPAASPPQNQSGTEIR